MRLDEALAYAKAHQPQVIAAEARIAAARADAEVPRAQWYPVVGAAAEVVVGTTNNTTATPINPGVLDVARIGGTKVVAPGQATMTPAATTYLGVGVGQEVFDFGRIAAQSAALDASVLVQRFDELGHPARRRVRRRVGLLRRRRGEVGRGRRRGSVRACRAHRDLAKAGVDSGLRPPIELTRAEADLKRFDVGRIRARGGLVAAQRAARGRGRRAGAACSTPPTRRTRISRALPSTAALLRRDAASATRPSSPRSPGSASRRRGRARSAPRCGRTSGSPETFSGRGGSADPSTGAASVEQLGAGWFRTGTSGWSCPGARSTTRSSRARRRRARARWSGAPSSRACARARRPSSSRPTPRRRSRRTRSPALARSREAAQANYVQVDARFKAGLSTASSSPTPRPSAPTPRFRRRSAPSRSRGPAPPSRAPSDWRTAPSPAR